MAHSDDRPFPTFFASYDEDLSALTPENSSRVRPIVIESDRLFKDEGVLKENRVLLVSESDIH